MYAMCMYVQYIKQLLPEYLSRNPSYLVLLFVLNVSVRESIVVVLIVNLGGGILVSPQGYSIVCLSELEIINTSMASAMQLEWLPRTKKG